MLPRVTRTCMYNRWQELVTVYASIQHIQWHAVHITASWACKCLWGIVLFESYFIISAVRQLIGQKAVGKVGWRELHRRSVTFYIHETSLNATVRSDLQHCCNKDPDTSAETRLNGTKYDAIPCRWCGSNDERVLEPKTTWMLCAGFCSLPHSYQALLSVPDLPTQLSIQGQWWSNLATQRLQMEQCFERMGRRIRQVLQNWFSDRVCVSASSRMNWGEKKEKKKCRHFNIHKLDVILGK